MTTLTALLALGALFERRLEESELLYQAAKTSYLDVVELGTLESVQLALQMAMFEINTMRSKAVWTTLAVAVRLCHSLVSDASLLALLFNPARSQLFQRRTAP